MFSFRTFLSRIAVAFFVCAFIPALVFAQNAPNRVIWKAGDMTVTVIQDLPGEMQASLFSGSASEKKKSKYFTDGKAEAGINVFLLQAGGKIALFDAGTGTIFKTPGKLPETLASLGVKPEEIDFVLLTHMHGDHIGWLLQEEKRAFPKAKLLVAKPELESWLALAETDLSKADEFMTANVAEVKKINVVYGADIRPFAFGETLLPGVTALDASGHTPGHTVFQLASGGKSLFIIGDLIHSMPLQFALPDECAAYDMDPPKAISARKRIFALAAQSGTPISGVHFPFAKAIGTIKKDDKGWKFKPMK